MGICKFTNRSVVGFVGVTFFALAILLTTISISTIISYGHLNEGFLAHYFTHVPAVVLLAVGMFFALGGMLAACVMCNHNKCLLTLLSIVIGILLVLLMGGGFELYKNGDKFNDGLRNETIEEIHKYENGTAQANDIDWIQKEIGCCGAMSYTDYEESIWWTNHTGEYPASCCQENCDGKPVTDVKNLYQKGCYTMVHDVLESNEKWIAIGTGVAIAVLALGLISTFALCFIKRGGDSMPYDSLTASQS